METVRTRLEVLPITRVINPRVEKKSGRVKAQKILKPKGRKILVREKRVLIGKLK